MSERLHIAPTSVVDDTPVLAAEAGVIPSAVDRVSPKALAVAQESITTNSGEKDPSTRLVGLGRDDMGMFQALLETGAVNPDVQTIFGKAGVTDVSFAPPRSDQPADDRFTTRPNPDPAEMQALVEQVNAGDPAALGEVFDRFSPAIYRYIYRRSGDPAVAEDLTGQTFFRLLESLQRGHSVEDSLSGLLYEIAHNLLTDHFRRQERRPTAELSETLFYPRTDYYDAEPVDVDRLRQEQQLREALLGLTPLYRKVILLRFIEGLSHADVAARLGKTETAVKVTQHRALTALRRKLGKREPFVGYMASDEGGQRNENVLTGPLSPEDLELIGSYLNFIGGEGLFAALTEWELQLVKLAFIDGLSSKRIANRLGMTALSVGTRIYELRNKIEAMGGTRPGRRKRR